MYLPVIRGIIDRRILVNYRVDPSVLFPLLPAPFRPKLVRGMGMAGICLIRLKSVRPRYFPSWLGISSENAAYRMAVEWDDHGVTQEGVYVRRRETSSRLNAWGGGKIFPGVQHHAQFKVEESADRYAIDVQSDDGLVRMSLRGYRTNQLPGASVFGSLAEASAFFQRGSLGYTPTSDLTRFQGMELKCDRWQVDALALEEIHSSFFENESLFPKSAIAFDCALFMQGIEHAWYSQPDLCCAAAVSSAPRLVGIEKEIKPAFKSRAVV